MRALAGRLPRPSYTGEVAYNGHPVETFNAARSAAFVAQSDVHIASLTARETAKFGFDDQDSSDGAGSPPAASALPTG